jgi:D-3-phosphoglycerate dehydrogenase / 2-oxoglutarate reductase
MPYNVIRADGEAGDPMPIENEVLAPLGARAWSAGVSGAEAMLAAARDADVLISYGAPIERRLIAGLERCLAIVVYGIGVDHIDLAAATEHGLIVANTPTYCVDEVATHALMLMLACGRRLLAFDAAMRAGRWPGDSDLRAHFNPQASFNGQQLGLVGFGNIARALAVRARPLGLAIAAHDPLVEPEVFAAFDVQPVPLERLLETSDFVSLHTPLLPATRRLIDAAALARMQPGAWLINVSRGGVIDQAALVEALQAGRLAGAALDVFEDEPLPAGSPLLGLPDVILTPHVAWYSDASFARVRRQVAVAAACVLQGQWPEAVVNPEVRGRSRMEARQAAPAKGNGRRPPDSG